MFKKEDLLNKAIVGGNYTEAQKLLKQKANADFLLGMRGTALCAALSANQPEIASLLLDSGCGVNVEDFDDETPLFLALRKECFEIAEKLIMHPSCKLNQKDKITGLPPLGFAAMMGFHKIVQLMVKSGCNVKATDSEGNTALHLAVKHNKLEVVQFLVSNSELIFASNIRGLTPLHLACDIESKNDPFAVVVILLSKWLDVHIESYIQNIPDILVPTNAKKELHAYINATTKYEHQTALFLATRKDRLKINHLLLSCGADPNIRSQRTRYASTCLMQACVRYISGQCLDTKVIGLLLKYSCNPLLEDMPGVRDCPYMSTPLHFSIENGCIELVKSMVQCISHSEALDITPPPLQTALEMGKYEIAWYFMTDVGDSFFNHLISPKGQLVHWLREDRLRSNHENEKQMDSIVKYLVQMGDALDGRQASNSCTPLQNAITRHQKTKVKVLLTNGADVRLSTSEQITSAGLCIQARDLKMLKDVLWVGVNIDDVAEETSSPLYLALENDLDTPENLDIVWFLLDSGCYVSKLCIEMYEDNECFGDMSSTDDESSDSNEEEELSEKDDNTMLHPQNADKNGHALLSTLRMRSEEFPDLRMLCVRCIRQRFQDLKRSFEHVKELGLPKPISNIITYNIRK